MQDALQEKSEDPASENGDGYGERELLRTHGVLQLKDGATMLSAMSLARESSRLGP